MIFLKIFKDILGKELCVETSKIINVVIGSFVDLTMAKNSNEIIAAVKHLQNILVT